MTEQQLAKLYISIKLLTYLWIRDSLLITDPVSIEYAENETETLIKILGSGTPMAFSQPEIEETANEMAIKIIEGIMK